MRQDPSLDSQQWVQVRDAFAKAVANPNDPSAWACGMDPPLVALVGELLDAHRSGSVSTTQVQRRAADSVIAALDGLAPGTRIGGFELGPMIGRGGMGVVYRARRVDGHVKQEVAIKFMRMALRDGEAVRRFRTERDVIARLNHPGIAGLRDAGETAEGVPYFVMELIEGRQISDWCAEQRLDLRARVRLVHEVCAAVQHAHENLVLHRDIKAENVLVTPDGRPRLIDFGIAKLLAEGEQGVGTATSQRVFSIANAAPEQLRGLPLGVACDVYQIGILLHGLVTGRPVRHVEGMAFREIEESILSTDPPLASSSATASVEPRLASAPSLLRGDLDAIIARCLRREPGERYPTVAALASDLDAWSADRPVSARKGQRAYAVRKFVGRHRLALLAAFTTAAVTFAFLAQLSLQGRELQAQRDTAGREAAAARETTRFLIEVFSSAEPGAALPPETPVSVVIDGAEQRISGALASAPLLKSRLLDSLAMVNYRLERFEKANELLRQSAALLDVEAPTDPARRVDHLFLRAEVSESVGRFDAASAAAEEAIALLEKMGRPLGEQIRAHRVRHSVIFARDGRSAALIADRALLLRLRADPSASQLDIARLEQDLAQTEARPGNGTALELADAAVGRLIRHLGPEHPETLKARGRRADVLDFAMRRHGEAISELTKLVEIQRRIYGPGSHSEAISLVMLGNAYSNMNAHADAVQPLKQAREIFRTMHTGPHPDLMGVEVNLGERYEALGRLDEALEAYEAAERVVVAALGAASPHAASVRVRVGRAAFKSGKNDLAEISLGRALESGEPNGQDAFSAALWLARLNHRLSLPGKVERYLRLAREMALAGDEGRRAQREAEIAALSDDLRRASG